MKTCMFLVQYSFSLPFVFSSFIPMIFVTFIIECCNTSTQILFTHFKIESNFCCMKCAINCHQNVWNWMIKCILKQNKVNRRPSFFFSMGCHYSYIFMRIGVAIDNSSEPHFSKWILNDIQYLNSKESVVNWNCIRSNNFIAYILCTTHTLTQ